MRWRNLIGCLLVMGGLFSKLANIGSTTNFKNSSLQWKCSPHWICQRQFLKQMDKWYFQHILCKFCWVKSTISTRSRCINTFYMQLGIFPQIVFMIIWITFVRSVAPIRHELLRINDESNMNTRKSGSKIRHIRLTKNGTRKRNLYFCCIHVLKNPENPSVRK